MKTLLHVLLFVLPLVASAQSARIGTPTGYRDDNGILLVPCVGSTNSVDITAQYSSGGVYKAMNIRVQDVSAVPSGYTLSNPNNDLSVLRMHFNTPHDGPLTFLAADITNATITHTFHFTMQSSPTLNNWTLPTVTNTQSGNLSIQIIDQPSPTSSIANIYNPPYLYYTAVNWTTNYGLRVNSSTSYTSGNTGQYNSQSISAVGSGGVVNISATNACGTSQSVSFELGPPYIHNPNLTLFDANSNMWQFTQIWQSPGTTYSFYVASGSATLSQNTGDCYITTSGGASVCVTATNVNGTCDPYCFYVPSGGSYMRAASPNPAKDRLTLQFTNTESLESLPSDILLYAENSTNAVRSVSVKDIYDRKAFEDGDKISLSVRDLPRGVYYVHAMQNTDSKLPTQKIRVILE